ncbi:acyl-CoA dehydrogenase family protein [Rhodococcus erythropolis]|uniref:acyl-CoA dehydrogenase family protein n=1 Tax=Rhodococcus erythropolis TaxID=1833 RepID=UPI0037ACE4F9
MEFRLSDEQVALCASVRKLLAARAPARTVFESDSIDAARTLWGQLSDAGLSTLGLDLPDLDLESSAIEQMLVAEELGRAAAPTPYIGLEAATLILSRSELPAAADLLGRALDGHIVVAALPAAYGGTVGVKASEEATGSVLHGEVLLVPGATWANTVLIIAEAEGSVRVYALDIDQAGCTVTPAPSIDPGSGLAAVTLDGAAAVPVLVDDADKSIHDAVLLATLLAAAESTGIAYTALHMAADYARTREQFGHPIGSFQAIKHKLADMVVDVENSRSACYGAAWKLRDGAEDAETFVHMAKAVAAEGGTHVAAQALQIHGGIGCTFEHPIHLYLRRAKANQLLYGDTPEHLESLAVEFLATEREHTR